VLPGDSIVAIDAITLLSWDSLVAKISASPGKVLVLDVSRGGERRNINVIPQMDTVTDEATGKLDSIARIGVRPRQESRPIGLGQAAIKSWGITWGMAGSVIDALKGLATRRVKASELGGPIMIATAS
jgi:regulator of sigma E protease